MSNSQKHIFIAKHGTSKQLDDEYDRITKEDGHHDIRQGYSMRHNQFVKLAFDVNRHNVSPELVHKAWASQEETTQLAASHHPLFSKEDHQEALSHHWATIRVAALMSHHATDEQLAHAAKNDPAKYNRDLANNLMVRSPENKTELRKQWYGQ